MQTGKQGEALYVEPAKDPFAKRRREAAQANAATPPQAEPVKVPTSQPA
jgi:hypothetical protein